MQHIILTQNRYAIVDDEDFVRVSIYNWQYHNQGYAHRTYRVNGKKTTISMHRFIMGDIPEGLEVDHKDSNGLNNQKNNLRICKPSDNRKNRSKGINCTSRFKGVTKQKNRNNYRVTINHNKKMYHLGCFDNEIKAALAYNIKAKELHGEFAKLNEVE